MDGFAHRASVQTEGAGNVLVITLQEGEQLLPYCCKIMESNRIPGLLAMRHQMVDGETRLRYSISGKVPLGEYMSRHHLPYKNGAMLLRNLSDAILHLEDYFLSPAMCEFDPELVYVGDGLRAYLPCVPVECTDGQDQSQRLKEFYGMLIGRYFATDDCSDYDAMFKWVYKTTRFDLQGFRDAFLKEDKPNAAATPVVALKPIHEPERETPRPTPPESKREPEDPSKSEIFLQKAKELYYDATKGKETGETGNTKKKSGKQSKVSPNFPIPIPEGEDEQEFPAAGEKKEKTNRRNIGGPPSGKEKNGKNAASEKGSPTPERGKMFFGKNKKQDIKIPEEDDWGNQTILAEQDGEIPSTPPAPVKTKNPYLTHKGTNVPLSVFPFKIGTYNTGIKLDYAIYDNSRVSRNHATIMCVDGQYCIRDNQSRNGTFLNGKALLPLQLTPLKEGDEIRLCDEPLIFHMG